MGVIDEKGRLFGKVNVIDFLVILFLLCLTPMFYLGYKILNRPPEVKKIEGISVSVDIYTIFKNLSPDVAKLISVGDKELDSDGNVIGEILDVVKAESNFIDVKLSETNVVTKEDAQRRQITAKLRIIGKLDANDILYKENKIKVGSEINFETTKYIAKGTVIPEPSQTEQISRPGFNLISLDILFKNLSPEVANLISVGDFEVDKDGDTVAKVLNIGPIEPYTYKIDLGGGNYITKTDPNKKQVQAKMEIMGGIEGNAFHFRDKRIALDSEVEFNTNKYKIQGIVAREPTPVRTSFRIPITLDILFKNLSPEVANLISVGDFEVDKDGDTVAKVLNIGPIEPYTYKIDLGGGNYITKTDPNKKQVQAKMEIMGGIEGNAFHFRDKRIALDSEVEFNTNKYKIQGIVAREPTPVKRVDKKWLLLKVRFTNLMPELVALIKEGDEERWASGDLVARVESIVGIEPSEVVIQDNRELIITNHPLNKDVVLLVKASCIAAQKGFLFKETGIKIGKTISLQTDKYDISGSIIEIKEINN